MEYVSPSSCKGPRNPWCSRTPDCNNWRTPLLPTPPVSPPHHPTSLTLWLFSDHGGIGMAGLSLLGRLMCPQRRRKCLALLQNAWSPMTHVSSLSVGAGLLGNRLSPEREVGRRPYSPFFPPGNLKLPTENCIQGLLFFA